MENYRIIIKGHLDKRWKDWYLGMEIEHMPNGESVLVGPVQDQSALYGIVRRLSGMNLTLLYLERLKPDRSV